MKTKKTLVSVLIPTYNSAEFIKDCVESIINQTYKNIEIIIVDDTSTDKTFDILKRLAKQDKRIRLFQNRTNLGITNNRPAARTFTSPDATASETDMPSP